MFGQEVTSFGSSASRFFEAFESKGVTAEADKEIVMEEESDSSQFQKIDRAGEAFGDVVKRIERFVQESEIY